MNKTMTVYLPTGERYFHTDTVPPERETREEDFWVAMGYVVTFTESAAAQMVDARHNPDAVFTHEDKPDEEE